LTRGGTSMYQYMSGEIEYDIPGYLSPQ